MMKMTKQGFNFLIMRNNIFLIFFLLLLTTSYGQDTGFGDLSDPEPEPSGDTGFGDLPDQPSGDTASFGESSSPEGSEEEYARPLFWVYYPHAREVLKKGRIFNDKNSAVSKSFDDIIISRRFNAVIYREENVYENRDIKSYIIDNAFMRLLESERIKEKIRNFEHDMWSW